MWLVPGGWILYTCIGQVIDNVNIICSQCIPSLEHQCTKWNIRDTHAYTVHKDTVPILEEWHLTGTGIVHGVEIHPYLWTRLWCDICVQTPCIVVRIGNESAVCHEIQAMDPLWVTWYCLYTVEFLSFIVSSFQKVSIIHCSRPYIYVNAYLIKMETSGWRFGRSSRFKHCCRSSVRSMNLLMDILQWMSLISPLLPFFCSFP